MFKDDVGSPHKAPVAFAIFEVCVDYKWTSAINTRFPTIIEPKNDFPQYDKRAYNRYLTVNCMRLAQ